MNALVDALEVALRQRIQTLAEQISGRGTTARVPPMEALLKAALRNEWETALLSSIWVTDEEDPELRIDLARLAGDEAKHFTMIRERLEAIGGSIAADDLNERSPLFAFLRAQQASMDRAVTGPFAREALAVARNEVFLEHCRDAGDTETIRMYNVIQADEAHHFSVGRRFLEKHLRTEDQSERALQKMEQMLQVVDDIQEMIVLQKGLCRIPGC